MHKRSPLSSPESSHHLNYSYEEDTNSIGSKNPHVESTFPKLRLPSDVEDALEDGGIWKGSEDDEATPLSEHQQKPERKSRHEDTSPEEGDESNEEDAKCDPNGIETDVEELPVLPKKPVKRKLMSEAKGNEKRTQKGRTKSSSPSMKKQRTPQIDASVITKLEFGRRPENSVSIHQFCS
jgi:hypothetical protein